MYLNVVNGVLVIKPSIRVNLNQSYNHYFKKR